MNTEKHGLLLEPRRSVPVTECGIWVQQHTHGVCARTMALTRNGLVCCSTNRPLVAADEEGLGTAERSVCFRVHPWQLLFLSASICVHLRLVFLVMPQGSSAPHTG